MLDKIMEAFTNCKSKNKIADDKIKFLPEIKVRRTTDILFISELRQTRVGMLATVDVGVGGDKAPLPLGALDDVSLKAIYTRLVF